MTPKEKAHELFNKYYSHRWQEHKSTRVYKTTSMTKSAAKKCALIAVDEVIEELSEHQYSNEIDISKYFWNEVKTEISNL